MTYDFAEVMAVYLGSDGEATRALYAGLESQHGAAGAVAVNVFRACKCSERAKVYRGRGYRGAAYDRKQWSLDNLAAALSRQADELGIVWGWGVDEAQPVHRFVLYVDLPTGQVSYHTGVRRAGPDYAGEWDGVRGEGPRRICRWIASLFGEPQQTTATPHPDPPPQGGREPASVPSSIADGARRAAPPRKEQCCLFETSAPSVSEERAS
jgi:hypothetical protein